MRWHGHRAEATPRTHHHRGDDRRHARGHVHHRATCEILQAHVAQPAAAPDPVADRRVDNQHPDGTENQHGGKAHALGKGTHDKRGCNDGEGHLEHREQARRNTAVERIHSDTGKKQVAEITDQRPLLHTVTAKGDAVTGDEPEQ